ncbi:MAG: MaoC family dehydratase N-terminal domain-containing protein [Chloroflexi bacterium]|nr:MaoC family dehydratase N-terminal domain-containing protein [Chloroflexota bacterium]
MAGEAVGMVQGKITDEEIERVRQRIGLIRRPPRYCEAATQDAIRHFCDGIGDDNPLFRDPTYATKTRWGSIVAPPCFLYAVWWSSGATQGFPGVHGFHSGNDWEFYRPIYVDDRISVVERLVDVVEKKSKTAGRIIIQYGEAIYSNQRSEALAKTISWTIRAERTAMRERQTYSEAKVHRYSPEEMAKIEQAYLNEEIRGANPRYWEDVNEGDLIKPMVKGPLNVTDIHGFIAGALGGAAFGRGGAHKFLYLYRKKHPAWGHIDPDTGVLDIPERVHTEDGFAQEVGLPAAYDYGCQRVSWFGNLLTHWMGDDAFLKKLYVKISRFNMLGDATWLKGKVASKYVKDGEHLVDLDLWAENHRGQHSAGRATVSLPSRSTGFRVEDLH